MSLTLQVNGVDYTGFTTIKVFRSFTNLSGGFNFTSVSSSNLKFPIEVGDSCIVSANGQPIITGFVEKMNIAYDQGQHIISMEGRDKTCDLIDSTIDDTVIYNPPISLKKVIENALKVLGITTITVTENVTIEQFNTSEIQSATIGDTFFGFLEILCRLRQVIMTTDGKGNIILDRASTTQINTVLTSTVNNAINNVKNSTSSFDNTNRFAKYRAYSQGNPVTYVDIPQTPQQLTNKQGVTGTDPGIRNTRQFNFISEKSAEDSELKNRAIWEANIRRAQSKVYACTVQGFIATKDNFIWRPNLLVQVNDDFSNTHGIFLIKDVTFNLSVDGGETTDLSLVVKDAYTLQAEQDAKDARVNVQGQGFVV